MQRAAPLSAASVDVRLLLLRLPVEVRFEEVEEVEEVKDEATYGN